MSERIEKKIIVSREYHNHRLDVVLAQQIKEYSRSHMSDWIKAGFIQVNKKPSRPKDKVKEGDTITVEIELNSLCHKLEHHQPENIALNIVFEDKEVLVVNKQAGLIVHPGAGNPDHTMLHALLHHAPNLSHLPRAGIVHRLDKETTGLLVVAKTLNAHHALVKQMQERCITRHYIALVYGHLISGDTIETGYARHPKNRLKMSVSDHGRIAITHFRIKKHYPGFTLLDVTLETGRTHQIRVHMHHIKHPIVGDPLYGGHLKLPKGADEPLINALSSFKRQALHAHSLSFTHPIMSERLTYTAPLPSDFLHLIDTLENYNESGNT